MAIQTSTGLLYIVPIFSWTLGEWDFLLQLWNVQMTVPHWPRIYKLTANQWFFSSWPVITNVHIYFDRAEFPTSLARAPSTHPLDRTRDEWGSASTNTACSRKQDSGKVRRGRRLATASRMMPLMFTTIAQTLLEVSIILQPSWLPPLPSVIWDFCWSRPQNMS